VGRGNFGVLDVQPLEWNGKIYWSTPLGGANRNRLSDCKLDSAPSGLEKWGIDLINNTHPSSDVAYKVDVNQKTRGCDISSVSLSLSGIKLWYRRVSYCLTLGWPSVIDSFEILRNNFKYSWSEFNMILFARPFRTLKLIRYYWVSTMHLAHIILKYLYKSMHMSTDNSST